MIPLSLLQPVISTQHDEVDKRPRASNPSPDIAYYLVGKE